MDRHLRPSAESQTAGASPAGVDEMFDATYPSGPAATSPRASTPNVLVMSTRAHDLPSEDVHIPVTALTKALSGFAYSPSVTATRPAGPSMTAAMLALSYRPATSIGWPSCHDRPSLETHGVMEMSSGLSSLTSALHSLVSRKTTYPPFQANSESPVDVIRFGDVESVVAVASLLTLIPAGTAAAIQFIGPLGVAADVTAGVARPEAAATMVGLGAAPEEGEDAAPEHPAAALKITPATKRAFAENATRLIPQPSVGRNPLPGGPATVSRVRNTWADRPSIRNRRAFRSAARGLNSRS